MRIDGFIDKRKIWNSFAPKTHARFICQPNLHGWNKVFRTLLRAQMISARQSPAINGITCFAGNTRNTSLLPFLAVSMFEYKKQRQQKLQWI